MPWSLLELYGKEMIPVKEVFSYSWDAVPIPA